MKHSLIKPVLLTAIISSLGMPAYSQTGGSSLDARLLDAAEVSDLAGVQRLLSQGADVNATEVDGTTPVLWAVYQHNDQLLGTLLAAGANPDQANRYGVSPLLLAARAGDRNAVFALL